MKQLGNIFRIGEKLPSEMKFQKDFFGIWNLEFEFWYFLYLFFRFPAQCFAVYFKYFCSFGLVVVSCGKYFLDVFLLHFL